MKKIALIVCLLTLSGCAGLDVEWELHATYLTDELRAKRLEQEHLQELKAAKVKSKRHE